MSSSPKLPFWHRHFLAMTIALVVALILGINVLAQQWLSNANADLSLSQSMALSARARTNMHQVVTARTPIDATLYFSDSVDQDPIFSQHHIYVRRILDRMARASHGMVRIRESRVTPFSEAGVAAQQYGLAQAENGDGAPLIFGLVLNAENSATRVLTWLDPSEQADADLRISGAMAALVAETAPPILVLTDAPWLNGGGSTNVRNRALANLAEQSTLIFMRPDFTQIPEGARTMLIANPPPMSAAQLSALLAFADRGGSLILALDHMSVAGVVDGGPTRTDQSWAPLLDGLGVGAQPQILADRLHGLPVALGDAVGNAGSVGPQPLFFATPSPLGDVFWATASPVYFANARWRAVWTLNSQPSVRTLPADDLVSPPSAASILANWPGDLGAQPLVAALKNTQNSGRVVVLGDADFLYDGLYVGEVGPLAQNARLLAALVAFANGDDAALRQFGHNATARPLAMIRDLKARQDAAFLAETNALTQEIAQTNGRDNAARATHAQARLVAIHQTKERGLLAIQAMMLTIALFGPITYILFGLWRSGKRG